MPSTQIDSYVESVSERLCGLQRWMPLAAALFLYSLITGVMLWTAYRLSGHSLVYPLDDPYITMAMARAFGLHGVWGITPYAFASGSSSPLFTLILALLYRVVGVNTWMALVLSWSLGAACLWPADRIARRYLEAKGRTVALVVFLLATPLFAIGVVGMENTLHLFLVLLFLLWLEEDSSRFLRLGVISVFMVEARYESLFLCAAACLLLAYRRQWKSALSIVAGVVIGVGVPGMYFLLHGGALLPNSVLIKGVETQELQVILLTLVHNFTTGLHLIFLLVALSITGVQLRKSRPVQAGTIFVVVVAGICHLIAARIGYAYRYESYLAGCGALLLVCAIRQSAESASRAKMVLSVVLGFAVATLGARSVNAMISLPEYSHHIYLKQIQMARFLSKYFPRASVAANDVGAINFFTDIHCVDLVGLGDMGVFRAKREDRYTAGFLENYTKKQGVQIAILYDEWFDGDQRDYNHGPHLPAGWIPVGRLVTPVYIILSGNVVSFYAAQPEDVAPLNDALHRFQASLPAEDHLEFPK